MKKYLPTIIAVIIVGLIAFYGGLKYGESKTSAVSTGRGNFQGLQGGNGTARGNFPNGGGFVSGQVLSVDPQGFTVKTRDGSSRIVLASTSTAVMKAAAGVLSDVTVGAEVTVTGSANSDGSYTAQSVQVRPTTPNPTSQ